MEGQTVTITKDEYDTLKADSLFADMAGDLIEAMPTGMQDLFEDDPRFKEWVKMVNHEWYDDMYGEDSES